MDTLLNAQVVIIDCQTNGSSPRKNQLLELGWSQCSAASMGNIHSSLIALKANQTIPTRIQTLIGINEDDFISASEESEVLSKLKSSLPKNPIFIAHYARFEQAFLSSFLDFSYTPIFCTFEIARRIYPDLPSRSIRAVSGFLGHHIEEAKRSNHHVEATFFIWQRLARDLGDRGIKDFSSLSDWLKTPPEKRRKKHYALSSEIRLNMPDQPGIYKMLGHDGRVLYVGKATSLRSRVNSYFRGQKSKGSRINELVSQIADIDIHVTKSSLEAALIESDAIKLLNPPYNRAQRSGNRAIGYTDSHFQTFSTPSRYGPLSSLRFIESIRQFKSAVDNPELMPESSLEVDPGTLINGLAIFRTKIWKKNDGTLNWPATLSHMWSESIHNARERRLLALNDTVEVETDDDTLIEDQIEDNWTPENIASYIYSAFTTYARGVHRGRWLIELANCRVYWRDPKSNQTVGLQVTDGLYQFGNIEEFEYKKATLAAKKNRFAITDLNTYDRMQVLYSELKQLLKKSNEVTLCLCGHRQLVANQIKKFVFPGDFDEED